MSFLDAGLKVVRLLSALVWLAVGLVTLWGTWTTFQDPGRFLAPIVESLQRSVSSGALALPQLQQLPPEVLQRLQPSAP